MPFNEDRSYYEWGEVPHVRRALRYDYPNDYPDSLGEWIRAAELEIIRLAEELEKSQAEVARLRESWQQTEDARLQHLAELRREERRFNLYAKETDATIEGLKAARDAAQRALKECQEERELRALEFAEMQRDRERLLARQPSLENCPSCNYPGHGETDPGKRFMGIYDPKRPCDHCGYIGPDAEPTPHTPQRILAEEMARRGQGQPSEPKNLFVEIAALEAAIEILGERQRALGALRSRMESRTPPPTGAGGGTAAGSFINLAPRAPEAPISPEPVPEVAPEADRPAESQGTAAASQEGPLTEWRWKALHREYCATADGRMSFRDPGETLLTPSIASHFAGAEVVRLANEVRELKRLLSDCHAANTFLRFDHKAAVKAQAEMGRVRAQLAECRHAYDAEHALTEVQKREIDRLRDERVTMVREMIRQASKTMAMNASQYPRKVHIVVNGVEHHGISPLTYQYGVKAGLWKDGASVSYHGIRKDGFPDYLRAGMLTPWNDVQLEDGMVFNAVYTGGA